MVSTCIAKIVARFRQHVSPKGKDQTSHDLHTSSSSSLPLCVSRRAAAAARRSTSGAHSSQLHPSASRPSLQNSFSPWSFPSRIQLAFETLTCLARTEARRPRRWPLPSMTMGVDEMVDISVSLQQSGVWCRFKIREFKVSSGIISGHGRVLGQASGSGVRGFGRRGGSGQHRRRGRRRSTHFWGYLEGWRRRTDLANVR